MRIYSDANAYSNNYTSRITGKAIFLGETIREKISELYSAIVHCKFEDTLGTTIKITSDDERYYSSVTFGNTADAENDEALASQIKFRNAVEVVAEEGLYGAYFVVDVQKVIESTGLFEYFGTDFNLVETNDDPEFVQTMGVVNDV